MKHFCFFNYNNNPLCLSGSLRQYFPFSLYYTLNTAFLSSRASQGCAQEPSFPGQPEGCEPGSAWQHGKPRLPGQGTAAAGVPSPRSIPPGAHPLLRAARLEGPAQLLALGGVIPVAVQALPELVPGPPARLPFRLRRRRHP